MRDERPKRNQFDTEPEPDVAEMLKMLDDAFGPDPDTAEMLKTLDDVGGD